MSEHVDDGLTLILLALDVIAELALRPDGYDEVAAEQVRLGQIISRAQLILAFIEAGKPASKVVGRMQ